jgi:uncharacterized protein (TIGR00369 family)
MSETPSSLPEEATELVRSTVEEEHGYLSWLGTLVETAERGRVTLTVPYDEKLTNPSDTVHGGVAATLVDTAGGLVQRLDADDPIATQVATVTLHVNYLRQATGDLRATAEIVRSGSTVGVSDVEVTSTSPDGEEEQLVATGQPAYRLFR